MLVASQPFLFLVLCLLSSWIHLYCVHKNQFWRKTYIAQHLTGASCFLFLFTACILTVMKCSWKKAVVSVLSVKSKGHVFMNQELQGFTWIIFLVSICISALVGVFLTWSIDINASLKKFVFSRFCSFLLSRNLHCFSGRTMCFISSFNSRISSASTYHQHRHNILSSLEISFHSIAYV